VRLRLENRGAIRGNRSGPQAVANWAVFVGLHRPMESWSVTVTNPCRGLSAYGTLPAARCSSRGKCAAATGHCTNPKRGYAHGGASHAFKVRRTLLRCRKSRANFRESAPAEFALRRYSAPGTPGPLLASARSFSRKGTIAERTNPARE